MPQFIPDHTPPVDSTTRGFLDCAEWLLDDEIDRSAIEGWSRDAIAHARAVCARFRADHGELIDQFQEITGCDDSSVGHDLFLTMNGHGAGFWDRDAGEVGDKLTDACERYTGCDAYQGDDGQLYLTGLA